MSQTPEGTTDLLAGHSAMLRRLAYSLLDDAAAADDVGQEALVLALQRPPRERGALPRWLGVVTQRLALRHLRARRRRAAHERTVPPATATMDPAAIAAHQETLARLTAAIRGLSAEQRQVIHLHDYEGRSLREIAQHLNAPLATIRSRRARAIGELRRRLDRDLGSSRWRAVLAVLVRPPRPAAPPWTTRPWALPAVATPLLVLVGAGVLSLGGGRAGPPAPRAEVGHIDTETLGAPVAASVVAAAPLGAPGRQPITTLVQGTVRSAAGRPVEGAWIMAGADRLRLRRRAESDAAGRFVLRVDRGDPAVACALARGHGVASPVPVGDGLELRVDPAGIDVVGVVVAEDGAPLRGAWVHVRREDEAGVPTALQPTGHVTPGFVVQTDRQGRFELPGLYPGWFACSARADGYPPERSFHTARAGATVDVRLTLARALVLSGTVRDLDGRAVAGVRVRVGPGTDDARRHAVTDAAGRYRLEGVRPSGDKAVAVGPDGMRAESEVTGRPGGTATWDPTLNAGRAFSGWVRDDIGRPLAGWWVDAVCDRWPGWRARFRTGADGGFAAVQCPRGPLRVEVFDPRHPLPWLLRGGVEVGAKLELTVLGAREPLAELRGRLLAYDGRPASVERVLLRPVVDGGDARLADRSLEVALESDGSFVAAPVPAGRFELIACGGATGWARVALPPVASRAPDVGDLRLPRPGTLAVRVDRAANAARGQTRYLLERLDVRQRIVEGRGDVPERFSLAPGEYRLEVELQPGPLRDLRTEVRPGEVSWLEVALDGRCRHRLRIEPAGPLVPSFVRLEVYDETARHAVDVQRLEPAEGALSCELALLPGMYRLAAVAADGSRATRALQVNTSVATRGVVLRLGQASAAGR
ncbi:MAG: sigma-70 family RNA polymerase sigma factor [Planctomycetota bacterium]